MTTKADISLSIRIRNKPRRKIELLEVPFSNEKYYLRIDGKKSKTTEIITITEFTHRLRGWMVKGKGENNG